MEALKEKEFFKLDDEEQRRKFDFFGTLAPP
jgi:hypothetical protein